ncbi:MAG: hypothetical protein HFH08_06620 [Bacilli bacterium]|nr:hypothetical protein [Bacilli bacterium]
MKKIIYLFSVALLLFCFFAPSFHTSAAAVYEVYVENASGNNLVLSAGNYKDAYILALEKEKEDPNNNVVIYADGRVAYATYALVNFRTKASLGVTTNYTIEFNGRQGYTNGYYGADAAFLGTNEDGTQVRFMQAGVIGWVNASEVEVLNMNSSTYTSFFTSVYSMIYTDAWELRHYIALNVREYGSVGTVILGQERPHGMADKTNYLSYDGHYFYPDSLEGYRAMMRDYKNGVRTSSINPNNPYYNYYQFLSHRSISNYTGAQIKQDFSAYTSKPTSHPVTVGQSQLFGEETSFIQYQNEFGANAIMMLGTAKNESSNGTSNIAVNKNNLFGHSAYDSAPGASADGYVSVSQSIFAHAKKFISEGYLDPCDGYTVNGNGTSSKCHTGRYYGGNLGDKSSGMNVKYASDPYWGEKAAQNYYYFDKKYSLQDYGKYSIGIKTSNESFPIKAVPTNDSVTLYTTGNSTSYAVTILGTVTGSEINGNNIWYKIQSDPTLNSTKTGIVQDQGEYNFDHNIAYIHSSYIGFVRAGKNEKNRYTVRFNPNGGKFTDNITSTKSLTVEEYVIPEINTPSREGYIFKGWDKEIVAATENVTYNAVWEPIIKTHVITFDAGKGHFIDQTKTKKLEVNIGELPAPEIPTLEGYTFIGWSPSLTVATKDTTYVAQYEKNDEIQYIETEGEFYFHNLESSDAGIEITGYSTINGIQMDKNSNVTYEIEFENLNTKEITKIPIDRILNENAMPFIIGKVNGVDKTYSWFRGNISLKALEVGDYKAYIVAKSGNLYTRKLVRNMFGKSMISSRILNEKQIWIRNNYYLKTVPMEFFVRNQVIAPKNNDPLDNMITGYSNISFEGTQLKIKGFAHNVNGDYAVNASIGRTIILENIDTYDINSTPALTITNGDYPISLRVSDGFDKTKAWFEASIDIASLEKGTYIIYVANSANISDFAELNDIFGKTITATTTLNGKNYSLRVNTEARYRIELVVK